MTPVLEISDLAVSYETDARTRRPVLRGLRLRVGEGEMVALVGRNGSGKTTLLRAIAGTLPRDAGRVELFGRAVERWSRTALARRVAVLPQSLVLPDVPGGRRISVLAWPVRQSTVKEVDKRI